MLFIELHSREKMFNKKYFQDRPVLFLNLVVVLGGVINMIATALLIDTSRTAATVRYESTLGLGGFPKGTPLDLYSFAAVALLVTFVSIFMSARLYTQKRLLSILVLTLAIVALLFNLIVAQAILNLQ